MKPEPSILFPPFRLDVVNERLEHGSRTIALRPKTFAVLRSLLERPGQLVTKEELLDAVWPDTRVSDAGLKDYIQEIRKALGDDARTPRFVETVHRRGYRFIAPLDTTPPVAGSQYPVVSREQSGSRGQQLTTLLVGREPELAQLRGWLEKALRGERQIVFVTGEPGIGKTTLVEDFLARVVSDDGLWIGRGQCIEHYGTSEPYMPVLEALGRLCRESGAKRLTADLRRYAPTWLAQMPALLSATEREKLQREVQGATRERMLREMAEATEALTTAQPLVLWLEDLHWSDVSTLELLSVLARRREQARLLVLGSYRPVEVLGGGYPLPAIKQELQLHRLCQELPLGFLSEVAVREYLAARLVGEVHGRVSLYELARIVHQCTEGNPLFMVNIVDYLIAQGTIARVDGWWEFRGEISTAVVPEDLRQMIERQIEQLSAEEHRVLKAASVVGVEFSVAAVAAGVKAGSNEVEERCEELVRRNQFLQARGAAEWPDGTVAARYGFIHALHQSVLYERITVGWRQHLHQQIGERLEKAYGNQAREVAAELAVHFERGRDYRRAVQYLQHAGENATQRSAYIEATNLLTKGLELLKILPDTSLRSQQELRLLTTLGPALMATKGYGTTEVEQTYARAHELCQCVGVGETPQLFAILSGLRVLHYVRAEFQTAYDLAEQCLTLARRLQTPALLMEAHSALGLILFWLGELTAAHVHFTQAVTPGSSSQLPSHDLPSGHNTRVMCLAYTARILGLLGYPDHARNKLAEAVALAQELAHPFSLAFAQYFAALIHQLRREGSATQTWAEAALSLSAEQGFPLYSALGIGLRGWALAEQGQRAEGITQISQGLAAQQAAGTQAARPYFLALLAEVYGKAEKVEEGLRILTEALAIAHKTGERFYAAELWRLKGELTLAQSSVQNPASRGKEAEECFLQAIDIARGQSAKSLELRAVMSLSRLWQRQGKKAEAGRMLAKIYGWFTEGFDTADLKEAKALIEELSH